MPAGQKRSSRRWSRGALSALTVLGIAASACGGTGPQLRRKLVRFARANATLTPEQQQNIARNTGPHGMPSKTWNFGRTDFVTRAGYVLEHSAFDRIPIWVAHYIPKTQIDGDPPGTNRPPWRNEPQLGASVRADDDDDYKTATHTFDRGHMTPNADFETSEGRNATFFLSNVVPQVSQNNRQLWRFLEERVRSWVMLRGQAYVITGPLFYDPEEESPGTADGTIEYEVIGANEVAVPTHLFKVVLAPTSSSTNAQWEAISFVFENRHYPKVNGSYPFEAGLRSIDWIEERAGLNFFPELDADPAELHRIESATPTSLWPTQ